MPNPKHEIRKHDKRLARDGLYPFTKAFPGNKSIASEYPSFLKSDVLGAYMLHIDTADIGADAVLARQSYAAARQLFPARDRYEKYITHDMCPEASD